MIEQWKNRLGITDVEVRPVCRRPRVEDRPAPLATQRARSRPVIVTMTFSFSSAMASEASLSYLGVGIRPPQASWGNRIESNIGSYSYRPWLVAVPALTLAFFTLGVNFLGDGLNDALNPKSSKAI